MCLRNHSGSHLNSSRHELIKYNNKSVSGEFIARQHGSERRVRDQPRGLLLEESMVENGMPNNTTNVHDTQSGELRHGFERSGTSHGERFVQLEAQNDAHTDPCGGLGYFQTGRNT